MRVTAQSDDRPRLPADLEEGACGTHDDSSRRNAGSDQDVESIGGG
jgi:hypothetical protein